MREIRLCTRQIIFQAEFFYMRLDKRFRNYRMQQGHDGE